MADGAMTELVERMKQAGEGEITMAEALRFDDKRMLEIARTGSQMIKTGQFGDAITIFRGLVALDPRVPFFHQGLGHAASLSGKLELAQQAFDVALGCAKAIPGNDEMIGSVLLERAKVSLGLSKLKAARKDLEAALDLPKALSSGQRATATNLLKELK